MTPSVALTGVVMRNVNEIDSVDEQEMLTFLLKCDAWWRSDFSDA